MAKIGTSSGDKGNYPATTVQLPGEQDIDEDDDGYKTPTSEESKIPPVGECPPAPRRPRPFVTYSRKRKHEQGLQPSFDEIDEIFVKLFSPEKSPATTVQLPNGIEEEKPATTVELPSNQEDIDDEEEGFRTPTSEESRIPPVLSSPPAPRRPRSFFTYSPILLTCTEVSAKFG